MSLDLPLTLAERAALHRKSDLAGWGATLFSLGLLAGGFAAAILLPAPFGVPFGMLLIGGRILGFAILTHDAAHNSVFASPVLNPWLGRWLFGGFSGVPYEAYRRVHMRHHRFAGTADDPDLPLVDGYPCGAASLRRKLRRDLTGATGVKALRFQLKSWATLADGPPVWLAHVLMLGLLWLAGHPLAYGVWWLAYLFVFPLLIRVRVIAEHGAVDDLVDPDPRRHTRSTLAPWWQRWLFAPNHVNYHLEHHLLPSIPPGSLPKAHRLLKARGFYNGFDCLNPGYGHALARCMAPPADRARRAAGGDFLSLAR